MIQPEHLKCIVTKFKKIYIYRYVDMYIYTLTCCLLFMLRSYMLCIFMFLFIHALLFSLYFPKRSTDQLSSLVLVKYKNYIRRDISPFWTSCENWNWLILDLNMSVLPIILKHFPKNSSVILLKIPDKNNTSRIKIVLLYS